MKYIFFDTALNGLYSLHILQRAYPIHQSLFKNTKDESLFDVAPYVFKVDDLLLEETADPNISLKELVAFESDETVDNLLTHFRPYLYKKNNGQENYFRFWDARVLFRFLDSSDDATLKYFFDGIDRFHKIDLQQKITRIYFLSNYKLKFDDVSLEQLFNISTNTQMEMQTVDKENPLDKESRTGRKFFK